MSLSILLPKLLKQRILGGASNAITPQHVVRNSILFISKVFSKQKNHIIDRYDILGPHNARSLVGFLFNGTNHAAIQLLLVSWLF